MLFKRYEEVILRLEDLGTRMGKLCNSERQELQSLLEEQAWLGQTLVKKARSLMEDIDKNFESLFDWMVLSSDLIDRAAEQDGRPDDVLRLKTVMSQAANLKEQLKELAINHNSQDNNELIGHEAVNEHSVIEVLEPETPAEVGVFFEAAAALEPDEVVAAVPVQPVKIKKVRKKKGPSKESANSYAPPQELLTSISRRVAPLARRHVSLAELTTVAGKIKQDKVFLE